MTRVWEEAIGQPRSLGVILKIALTGEDRFQGPKITIHLWGR